MKGAKKLSLAEAGRILMVLMLHFGTHWPGFSSHSNPNGVACHGSVSSIKRTGLKFRAGPSVTLKVTS